MRAARAQQENRRRHARFPLGLPVQLRMAERPDPMIVEIVDVSEGGLRLRSLGDEVRTQQKATLRFVLPDQRACEVEGHISRLERGGAFVLELDRANGAFTKFLKSLAAEAL